MNTKQTRIPTKCSPPKADYFTINPSRRGTAKWRVSFFIHAPERKRPHEIRRCSPVDSKAATRQWAQQVLPTLSTTAHAQPVSEVDVTPEVAHEASEVMSKLRPNDVTVARACERWLATQSADMANNRRFVHWLRLAWGENTLISDLTHEQLVGLPAKLSRPLGERATERSLARRPDRTGRPRGRKGEGLAPGSVRAICQAANRILAFAAGMKWREPSRVPLPVVPVPEAEWLSVEELAAVFEHAGPWRLAVKLGARAGLRRGEIVELRWRDIDLAQGKIRVARAFKRKDDGSGEWHVATCKGRQARTVTIPPDLVAALSAVKGKRDHLVVTIDGQRINPGVFSEMTSRIIETAGVFRPGLGVHALRHTYCAHLAQGGAPAKAIQLLAGHSSERTTARYTHLSPRAVEAAVKCLPTVPG